MAASIAGLRRLLNIAVAVAAAGCSPGGSATSSTGGGGPGSTQLSPLPTATASAQVTPDATGVATVTDGERGAQVNLHVGQRVAVRLVGGSSGGVRYVWTKPAASDTTVLAARSSHDDGDGGVSASFDARAVGTSDISAAENPQCPGQCGPGTLLWTVAVTVTAT